MDERTNLKYQLISAWCGPVFVLAFVLFWGVIAHNLPAPPAPSLSALEVAERYRSHLTDIRLGFIVSLVIVVLYMPWTSLLATQMAQIEGRYRTLTYLQLIGGALTVMVVSFSAMFWLAAAFRPERAPEITQMLTDVGWLCVDTQYACTTLQMVAAALVGLADQREKPLFPEWVCYLTIACGLSFIPASLTGVLKTGPFAWNGMLSYYIPYFAWLFWFAVASFYMIREVRGRMVDPTPAVISQAVPQGSGI